MIVPNTHSCDKFSFLKSLSMSSYCYKLVRLRAIRKKALNKAKKWNSKDDMASHSYKIMVEVIDRKLSLLTVNK